MLMILTDKISIQLEWKTLVSHRLIFDWFVVVLLFVTRNNSIVMKITIG